MKGWRSRKDGFMAEGNAEGREERKLAKRKTTGDTSDCDPVKALHDDAAVV